MEAIKNGHHAGWWTVTPTGRYRLTAEGSAGLLSTFGISQRPGTFIAERRLIDIRDSWIDSRRGVAQNLASQLKAGTITTQEWVLAMRAEIKSTHIAQYVLGRGGLGNMSQADWGRLGSKLRDQYGYLNEFASQILANPQWSEARIAARSQMYFEASSASFEAARGETRGVPTLPQYPGDGGTQCLSNCNCYWRIVDNRTAWHCFWTLRPAEHCPDCVENASKWGPLIIPKIAARHLMDLRNLLKAKYAARGYIIDPAPKV